VAAAAPSRPLAGDGVLDPVAVVALVVLWANDHLGKAAAAGTAWAPLTGKLSDVAGLVLLPVLVVAAGEVWADRRRRASRLPWGGPDPRLALVAAVLVMVTFAAMKTTTWAGQAYALTLGALQWPAHAVLALVRGEAGLPPWRPVQHVVDPSDLVALPGAWYVVRQARCRARSWASSGPTKAANDAR
jgi:hypothetical protein